jgi:hypothetical protein
MWQKKIYLHKNMAINENNGELDVIIFLPTSFRR